MSKGVYYLASSVGGAAGSYVPVLFGAGMLSLWSIVGGMIGGILGIFVAYKIGKYY